MRWVFVAGLWAGLFDLVAGPGSGFVGRWVAAWCVALACFACLVNETCGDPDG